MMQDQQISKSGGPPEWLQWAVELQALAQAGLAYSKDEFDRERFRRVRAIAAEIMSARSGLSLEVVEGLFCNEAGYQTPKLDCRAAVFDAGNRILLVQEKADGLWALPGGWVDVNESIRSNLVKEVQEEAGMDVEPLRLIALHDRNRHNPPPFAYGVCKVFALCRLLGGKFAPNTESSGCGFFTEDRLPPLSLTRNTQEQIALCFRAHADAGMPVEFD
ncbi:NUDIX hydrolase N-terminal domain-containing protein [Akkermansia glycaniphila]|uniref:Nudix domain n=1 Tax=Akkermansia glycaniphila TaxID=1679444 RepID=A0A1C7PE71_9BACT|nr:NUDIX hydrolase [Akkermansia glycaniphila]OCA03883.1 ADP-ribose pyrophosphatase [Akkermansia glycaniphila]SEH69991.1 nudix domain [Akkermansia glycaniphila]